MFFVHYTAVSQTLHTFWGKILSGKSYDCIKKITFIMSASGGKNKKVYAGDFMLPVCLSFSEHRELEAVF